MTRRLSSSTETILSMTPSSPFLTSHSHTVTTVQPIDSRASVSLRSRSTFLSNFSCQNSRLCSGSGRLQWGHLCQKHPLTNIATFLPG